MLGVERLAQEVVHRLGLADRGRRAPGAADRVLGRDVAAAVGLALVVAGLPHDLVRDPARVRELQPLGAEALDLGGLDPGALEPVGPVADRGGGDGDVDRLGLVGPALAHPARLAVGEAGEDRARVADPVGVVEVVDRDLAVEEHGLLDALQAEGADVEVVVLLRPADAEGEVVGAFDRSRVGHSELLLDGRPSDVLSANGRPRDPLRRHRLDGARPLRGATSPTTCRSASATPTPVHGRDAVRDVWAGFCETVDGVSHEIVEQFESGRRRRSRSPTSPTPRRTAARSPSPWSRSTASRGELIDDYRVFIDLAPLFA